MPHTTENPTAAAELRKSKTEAATLYEAGDYIGALSSAEAALEAAEAAYGKHSQEAAESLGDLGQIHEVLGPEVSLDHLTIAYEPVWAIGTGRTATPDQAQAAHAFIRQEIGKLYNSQAAEALCIQYGGSVKASNAQELMSQPDVDGALVGGASLKADEFLGIIEGAIAAGA